MNRTGRLRWWWRSVWGVTVAALGLRSSTRFRFRWSRPGPPPDLSKVPRPAWLPPDDEIGVASGVRTALVSGDQQVLSLVDCVGYSNGFEFTISYRSRQEISRQLLGIGPPPTQGPGLLVTIEYPDGGRATSADRGTAALHAHYEAAYQAKNPALPGGPVVMPQRSGGGGKRYDFSYWCWPLPPDGGMKITVEWPAAAIPATSVEIDASSIRRAGLSSTRFWRG